MNLSIAAKLGVIAFASVAVLASCMDPVVQPVAKTTYTVSPADKTTGVLETAKVVLTFSAAMPDAAKTIITLKDGATVVPSTPTWDTTKKILTVSPTSALGFSKVISVVGTASADAAGLVVDAKTTTFTVKAATTGTGGTKTGTLTADGSIVLDLTTTKYAFYATPPAVANAGTFNVGDVGDGAARGVLRFALPAGVTAAQVASATLEVNQKIVTSTPYTSLGGLQVQGGDFGTAIGSDNADSAADFASGTTTFNGPVAELAAGVKLVSVDVTSYVTGQLTAGKTNADLIVRFKNEPTTVPATQVVKTVRFFSSEAVAPDDVSKPVLKVNLK
jgi:hypothetical protein